MAFIKEVTLPDVHCIPPWRRGLSPRKRLAGIVVHLLGRHAGMWSSAYRGTVSYQFSRGSGYWIIFRTPTIGDQRLAVALVLTRAPRTKYEWSRIRQRFDVERAFELGSARYRYLFVGGTLREEARKAMSRSGVEVMNWDAMTACS